MYISTADSAHARGGRGLCWRALAGKELGQVLLVIFGDPANVQHVREKATIGVEVSSVPGFQELLGFAWRAYVCSMAASAHNRDRRGLLYRAPWLEKSFSSFWLSSAILPTFTSFRERR